MLTVLLLDNAGGDDDAAAGRESVFGRKSFPT